jgi:DNA-binding MarR family transcriptional regulator
VVHLGRYGKMTAKEICDRARIHKTKVSRAVQALEQKRFLARKEMPDDRRHETLKLTSKGQKVFQDLLEEARSFDASLMDEFTAEEAAQMRAFLVRIAKL